MPSEKRITAARRYAHRRVRQQLIVIAKTIIGVGGGLVLCLAFTLTVLIARTWNKPLGLQLATLAPASTAVSDVQPPAATIPGLPTHTPQPAGEPQCGGPPVMYVLLVGKDEYPNNYATGFADVIRIARVDFITPSITLLSIPRDLWVRIPGLETYQIVEERVKTTYAYGFAYRVPGGGPNLLAQTLDQNFGLQVDYYAVANFATFKTGIDAIGGIEVDVLEPVGDFPAGLQHMDGELALTYVRLRQATSNPSDLNRIERQTRVIMAVRQKMLAPEILPSMSSLITTLQHSALTNMSPAEIYKLLCIGRQIEPDNFQIIGLDSTMLTSQIDAFGHEILIPDRLAITDFVQAFNRGEITD